MLQTLRGTQTKPILKIMSTHPNRNIVIQILISVAVINTIVQQSLAVIQPPKLSSPLQLDPRSLSEAVSKDRNFSLERFFLSYEDQNDVLDPISLTVQQQVIKTQINSDLVVILTLNKILLDSDINVKVTVKSGPSLIHFTETNSSSFVLNIPKGTCGDEPILLKTFNKAGHAELTCEILKPTNISIDISKAYVSIDIAKNLNLQTLIDIVGWIYFFAWSISFYFQVALNYSRKSVVGLNFDFLALNLLGFSAYTIYNVCLFFSRTVQQEYYHRSEYHRIPVEWNDLLFSIHAVIITLVTIAQCFYYERGTQSVSIFAGLFIGGSVIINLALYLCFLLWNVAILDVLLCISYVKLVVTLIKYIPQAWMNSKYKSTEGWSIANILLDFTGGIFSLAQMMLIAYNYDDWISIFGNFTKFGLGAISICFDVLFFIQHFILYRPRSDSTRDLNDSSYSQDQSFDEDESERQQRRIQASSGAIQASINKTTNSNNTSASMSPNPLHEDLIA